MGKRGDNRTKDLSEIRKDPTKLWSDSVGEPPYTVLVLEVVKRGKIQVFTRHQEPDGSRPYKLTNVGTIRDARRRPVTRLKDEALAEARERYEELAGLAAPKGPVKLTRLTLAKGLETAFGENGHWSLGDPTNWGKDVHGYLSAFIELLHRHNKRNPKTAPLHYDEVTPGMLKGSMRTLAKDGAENRDGQGLERANKMYRCFFALCRWLTGEYPDLRFPADLYQWRQTLGYIWEEETGRDLELEAEQSRPRHTLEEQIKLYASLDKLGVDRRLALLLRIGGGEQRMGQVRATMRSRVDLSPGAGIGYGVVRPRGRKRKKASPTFLTAEERAFLDVAMTDGYLRELEKAYQTGALKDYPLFCSGKFRHPRRYVKEMRKQQTDYTVSGVIPLGRKKYTPIDKGTLSYEFHELERIAGVDVIEGRGWYGLRRLTSDLFEELAKTMEGVGRKELNIAQSWDANSTVREDIYQNKERVKALSIAAELRQRVRELGLEKTEDEAMLNEPLEELESGAAD
jgi:hypothetical protein